MHESREFQKIFLVMQIGMLASVFRLCLFRVLRASMRHSVFHEALLKLQEQSLSDLFFIDKLLVAEDILLVKDRFFLVSTRNAFQ